MRLSRVAVFVVAVTVLLTAAAPPSAAKTKIVVWDSLSSTGRALYQQVVEEFMRDYPDIEVEMVYQSGYYEAMEKILVSYAGGVTPNVVMMEQSIAFALIDKGLAAPITPYMANDPEIDEDDFFPAMRATVTVDGQMYGVPYNVSTPLLYFNKNLFRQNGLDPVIPDGRDALLALARKLTRYSANGDFEAYGFWLTRWRWLFEAWVGRAGGRILNEDRTEFIFNSPEAVSILEFAQSLVHEYRVAGYGSGAASGHTPFLQGRLGMMEYSTAGLRQLIEQSDANGIDMGVVPLPGFEEKYVPIGGALFMMLNTGTEAERQASWEFLKYISRPENQARFAVTTGYMVSRRSALETDLWRDFVLNEPRAQVTYMQLDYAYPRPQVPFWDEIQQQLRDELSDVMFRDNGNFKPVLDEIVRLANLRLAELRSH